MPLGIASRVYLRKPELRGIALYGVRTFLPRSIGTKAILRPSKPRKKLRKKAVNSRELSYREAKLADGGKVHIPGIIQDTAAIAADDEFLQSLAGDK
jgi:hypothetical protein